MGVFDVKRVGVTLATVGALLGTVLLVSLNADAVAVSKPVYGGGNVDFAIDIEDPDHVTLDGLILHFDCAEQGVFSEAMALVPGATSAHAKLLFVTGTGTNGYGYGYFEAEQTGYGYSDGQHGYATGETGVVTGYGDGSGDGSGDGYDTGYSNGYGYGYGSGSFSVRLGMIASAFIAWEECTLVVELVVNGGIEGDFESPPSAPFIPRQPPIADAGLDFFARELAPIGLDGSLSVDPDALPAPLNYTWTQLSGIPVVLDDKHAAKPGFLAPAVPDLALLVFQIKVTDGLDFDTDVVNVTVLNAEGPWFLHANGCLAEDLQVTLGLPPVGTMTRSADRTDSVDKKNHCAQVTNALLGVPEVYPAQPPTQVYEAGYLVDGTVYLSFLLPDPSLQPILNGVQLTVGVSKAGTSFGSTTVVVPANTLLLSLHNDAFVPFNFVFPLTAGLASGDDFDFTLQVTPTLGLAYRVGLEGDHASQFTLYGKQVPADGNQPPVADAGDSQEVEEGEAVGLSGAASTDPDGDDLTYLWTQTDGPAVTLTGATTATASFTAPQVTGSATLLFQLKVTDEAGLSSIDTVLITVVDHVNVPPAVDAGDDFNADEGASVTLAGAASDGDGPAALAVAWSQVSGPAVTLSGSATLTATFTAPAVDEVTALVFKLTANDGAATAFDLVLVNVQPIFVGQPPLANAGPDQMVYSGTAVVLDGEASFDPDGTTVTYQWTQTSGPTATLASPTAARPTFTAPAVPGGTPLTFRVRATDADGNHAFDAVTVLVRSTGSGGAGSETWYLHGDGCLAEDLQVTVALPPGLGTITRSADHSNAADDEACIQTVLPLLSNEAETYPAEGAFAAMAAGSRATGTVYLTTLLPDLAWAPFLFDGVRVDVELTSGATSLGTQSVRIDADTLLLNLLPGSGYAAVPFAFTTTGDLAAGQGFAFNVRVAPTVAVAYMVGLEGDHASHFTLTAGSGAPTGPLNARPAASAGSDQAVNRNTAVTLDASASSDSDGQVTAFAWTQVSGPRVVLSDAGAATAGFTAPSVTAATDLVFRLQVGDGHLTSTTDDVKVTVRALDTPDVVSPTNQPPVARAGSDQNVDEGDFVILDASASSDPQGSPLAFAWTQVSGPAIQLTEGNAGVARFVAPTVNASRVLGFRVTVTDPEGLGHNDTVAVLVRDVPTPTPEPEVDDTTDGQGDGSGDGPDDDGAPAPTACELSASATADTDGDGFRDRVECKAGSNPNDAASAPQFEITAILSVERGPNGNILRWSLPNGEVLGFLIWSSNSPYVLLDTVGADTTEYTDSTGTDSTKYKLTFFVDDSAEGGKFTNAVQAASLTGWVNDAFNPTTDRTQDVQTWHIIAGSALALGLAIVLVAMVVYAVRPRKGA